MPVDRYQTLTDYRHPQDSNLMDVHRAMDYSAAGEPLLRVNNVGGVSYNEAGNISAGTDSSVEYDIAATALSGGTVLAQGVFVGSNKGGSAQVSSQDVDFSQQLGRTIAGVSDIWCLAAIATTNNDDAVGVVNWQEHI